MTLSSTKGARSGQSAALVGRNYLETVCAADVDRAAQCGRPRRPRAGAEHGS